MFFCLSSSALAFGPADPTSPIGAMNNSGGLSCTGATVQQSEEAQNDYWQLGYQSEYTYLYFEFAYTGITGDVCRLDVLLSKTGAPAGLVYAYIYTNNTLLTPNAPNNILVSFSSTVDASTVSASPNYTWYPFTGGNGTLTNGVTYHGVLKYATIDAENYLRCGADSTAATENIGRSDNGIIWTNLILSQSLSFKIYIKE